ncbi:S8 family peptidase [Priestia flexa]|uniref:S8 family peptidase n=1 Tax=Priestia flexa TaxID=86664 RepID=UPI001CFC5BDA|nr:S8 family peptidase [Priestia flexa]
MDKKENRTKFPILGNGESLIEPTKRNFGSGPTSFPRSFSEAKVKVKKDIEVLRQTISKIPSDKRMEDIIVTVRLHEKFLAKSYTPNSLFKEASFENIGSRRWRKPDLENNEEILSKMHFVKVNHNSLDALDRVLNTSEDRLTKSFKQDIRKLDELSLLDGNEIMQGFESDWEEGTVEFVLHPFGDKNTELLEKFLELLRNNGVSMDTIRIKEYPDGPIFLSAFVKRSVLNEISNFNPLRTVHPIKVNLFPSLRNYQSNKLDLIPPKGEFSSKIKVGVFDGGIDKTNPFLINYAIEKESVPSQPVINAIKHGTQVAGVVLYGDLNQYAPGTQLKDPLVTVESFRVLPQTDPKDFDLYEAIDFIENIVPYRNDIDVYNLSFGPIGPIYDDEVSRFTYSLDRMAWYHRKLFVVAVGNDGDQPAPLNRVQAPSDLVNGLGVGAFSYDYNSREVIRASYSCVGEGREGCKVKPDLCAFGGDERFPIHLLSLTHNSKELSAGTSFSSPIISGKAAEILGRCNQFNALSARALLIHTANHMDNVNMELGYGIIDKSVDDILSCDENKVTIVYSAEINPTGMAKLPLPLPLNAELKGDISFSWTIATLSKANPLHVEDYTESAIEDTFYPNSQKYNFSKKGIKNSRKLHLIKDKKEIERITKEGWQQSLQPASSSPVNYLNEQARRLEFKWDTVVKKWKNMRSSSIDQPFLILHGMGRNGSHERMEYACVVTIHAPKYSGNLHEDILNEYKVLQPISVRARNEIMVRI